MSKKMKLVVAILAAVMLLGLGGTAMVMAADPPPDPSPTPSVRSNPFLEKLARILGVTRERLESAIQEARTETRDEALTNLVEKALADKRITEQEAEQIRSWWNDRPEAIDKLLPGKPPVLPGFGQAFLDNAVKKGTITQDEAGQITEWWANRPDALGKVLPVAGKIIRERIQRGIKRGVFQLRQSFHEALENAENKGIITSDEASQIEDWISQRPAAVNKVLPFGGMNLMAPLMGIFTSRNIDQIEKFVDTAVQNNRITLDEANDIKGWLSERPAGLDKLVQSLSPAVQPGQGMQPRVYPVPIRPHIWRPMMGPQGS